MGGLDFSDVPPRPPVRSSCTCLWPRATKKRSDQADADQLRMSRLEIITDPLRRTMPEVHMPGFLGGTGQTDSYVADNGIALSDTRTSQGVHATKAHDHLNEAANHDSAMRIDDAARIAIDPKRGRNKRAALGTGMSGIRHDDVFARRFKKVRRLAQLTDSS
jgi:hypothetical protein